jgi:hypothetical protein
MDNLREELKTMSQIAQQAVTTTFDDPHNIVESFANGPISLNVNGQVATLTFTVIRGDLREQMSTQVVTKVIAAVVSRVVLPLEGIGQLRVLLNQMIQDQPGSLGFAPGSTRTQ